MSKRPVHCGYWERVVYENRHCQHFPFDFCAGDACPGPHTEPEESQLERFDEIEHVADDIWDELPPQFKHRPFTPPGEDYPNWLMNVAAHVVNNAEMRRAERTPQFCPSTAYMVRASDNALVAYRCARPFGHTDERPHRNGIASDAGSWTTEQALESLEYVLEMLRAPQAQDGGSLERDMDE